jgi:hypothetical protein
MKDSDSVIAILRQGLNNKSQFIINTVNPFPKAFKPSCSCSLDTLISVMTVFFFLIKKTQVQIPEPKRTGSIFFLSVWYQYSFFNAKKKTIIMKMGDCMYVCIYVYTHVHVTNHLYCQSMYANN